MGTVESDKFQKLLWSAYEFCSTTSCKFFSDRAAISTAPAESGFFGTSGLAPSNGSKVAGRQHLLHADTGELVRFVRE